MPIVSSGRHGPTSWPARRVTAPDVDLLARDVVALRRPALIAVDGVDGAGKTTFAARLAAAVEDAGRPTVVVHEDDFLAPRATRYRLGKDSPEGFFADSYDLAALARDVLDPLAAGSDRDIRRRAFDHRTDSPVDVPAETVPDDGDATSRASGSTSRAADPTTARPSSSTTPEVSAPARRARHPASPPAARPPR